MGCFSFLCQECGKGIKSSSFDGERCKLYLLQGGKVIDLLEGEYNSYGSVFIDTDQQAGPLRDSRLWQLQISTPETVGESGYKRDSESAGWSAICDLMFSKKIGNGIAAVHECCFTGNVPTMRSLDDPNQGWGDYDPDADEDDEDESLLGNISDGNSYPTQYVPLAETWKGWEQLTNAGALVKK